MQPSAQGSARSFPSPGKTPVLSTGPDAALPWAASVCPLSPTLPPSFLSLSFLDVSCLQQKPVFVFPAELEISVCFTLNRVDCLEKNFTKWKGTFKTKSRSACGLGHRVPGRRVCLCKRHSCAGDICRGGRVMTLSR